MKKGAKFLIGLILCLLACNQRQEKEIPVSFAPKVVEAHGYVVPKDSIAEPIVIPVGKPRVVKAGKPKVFLINTNVHLAGTPKVVIAGAPRISTPGQDSFSLPITVPAIDSPFIAGIPEVVIAKDAYTKDHNPQSFSSFGKQQGLKNEYIRDLIEDRSGNLWFATNGGGVGKYDGKSFTHFTEKEGLSSLFIKCILEDKNGNLWFGTWRGGVSKYDGKNFTHFSVREGLLNNTVNSMLEDNKGNIWLGTDGGGVSKYEPAKDGKAASFTHFTVKEGLSNNVVNSMLQDEHSHLWFGTAGGGVSQYDGKSFTHFTVKEGLSKNNVESMIQDKNGHLWFGTAGGGVSQYDGKKFTHFTVKEGLINNNVTCISEDKNGNLWFGTWDGICNYNGFNFTHYSENEGLSDNSIKCILEDRSGNLWFGTGGGVSKYGGNRFTHFTDKEGLKLSSVVSILEDKSGNLWFGTNIGGVYKYDASGDAASKDAGKSFTQFTTTEGLSGYSVWHIMEDRSGILWFATGGGVSRYDGKYFTHFTEKEGLIHNDVKSILEDRWGNIWFGVNGGGVSKYDGKSFTQFGPREGLSINNVMSIHEDTSGNLWFCGYLGGVTKYDPSAGVAGVQSLHDGTIAAGFTHFTVKEGLTHNDVRIILEDKSGDLWFSTIGGGVSEYEPPKPGRTAKFTHYTEKEGLTSNVVASMMEDKSGNLWFGTNLGLNKLEKEKEAFNTRESGLLFKTYSYEDGFSGIGVSAGNTICEAKDGTIWIGTNDGLTAFHPEGETPDTIAPSIQLTGLELFNQKIGWQNLVSISAGINHNNSVQAKTRSHKYEVNDTSLILGNGIRVHDFHFDGLSRWYGIPEHLSLAYNNNNLTFQFVGITMHSPKKVKYQYKLEGLDQNWSASSYSTEALYAHLPHGRYTFKIKAMNSEGYWSKELDYSFTIRPPWWLTSWAYLMYGLILGLSGVQAYRYQKQRILRLEREKAQTRDLEQAKEIEKAYTELKATQAQLIQSEKMASLGELTAGIAHEIQNPLNFVNNFSEINKELIDEIKQALTTGNSTEALNLTEDIRQNLEKINFHGKRADGIVKSMLQHSRSSEQSGKLIKEPTDINILADEYLRLAYHGLRAKDQTFNASLKTDFDASIGLIQVIPQDIARVMLNLITNALYAVHEKEKRKRGSEVSGGEMYTPTVSIVTKKNLNNIEIHVKDNGPGIPPHVLDKIFQPFFTTKPTGQGTGLGLSLAYDIIKAHGGTISVSSFNNTEGNPPGGQHMADSKETSGTEFIVSLPS